MITKAQIGPLSLLFDDVKWFFACKSFISHQRWQIARMIIKQFIISSWDMQFSRHLSIYLSWHPLIMARGKLEMAQKCNQCDFASEWADSLRKHSKIHNGDRSYKCNQCDYAYSGSPFEDTFKISLWRQIRQMQPMWLCNCTGFRPEKSFENSHWRILL